MVRDMTSGTPWKLILQFSIPLMLGSLCQQFYSMADTIIVGKFLGVEALAAVGSTGSLHFLMIGFLQGLCSGFAIPVAQYFGARDEKNMQKSVANAAWLSIGITIIATIATVSAVDWILGVMRTPANIFEGASTYLKTICIGICATMLYDLLAALLRALGDSKTPLYFLLLSSVLNIIFDIVFIVTFHWGVAGAAWATVLSQGIAGLLCTVYVMKKFPALHIARENTGFSGEHAKQLIGVGIPMGLQCSIIAIGSTIMQSAVNSLGSNAVAAVTAASKVQNLLLISLDTYGLTMATYTGQNLGAGRIDRIKTGVRQCLVISFITSVICTVVIRLFGTQLATLFVDSSETVILAQVDQFLYYTSFFYFFLGSLFILRTSIQGMGYTVAALASGAAEMIARSILALGFVSTFGYYAVCFSDGLSWLAANFLLVPLYITIMKRLGAY